MTKSKRVPKSRVYQILYAIINNSIGKKYRTYKASPGAIELLMDRGGGEVVHVPLDQLANEIIRLAHIGKDIDIGPADAKPAAHWWIVNNHEELGLRQIPAPILGKSDGGLCFKRLPFDYRPYSTYKEPRHFLEFCGRSSDPDSLQAFIGSLFVPDSYRQQYLYLFGHGSDGKGTLFNLLERMLGDTYTAEDVPDRVAAFWSSGLIGKRLCVFPDLEDPSFPTTPRFRKLTGDDFIRVEEKFKKSYSTKIFTKFIFASNDELQMTSKKADQRRAIYIAMKSFEGRHDPDYLSRLWEEAPAIYALCLEKYKKMCPGHSPIMQVIKEPIEFEAETILDDFFGRYFNNAPKGHVTGAEWQRAKKHYFNRRPTAAEDRMLLEALEKRGGGRKRTAKGFVLMGITRKSHMQAVHEGASNWP